MKSPILKVSFLLCTLAMLANGCQSDDQLNAEDWFRKGLVSEKAIDDFTKALKIDAFYADAYFNRGITWFNKGNFHQALADIGTAFNLKPGDQRNNKETNTSPDSKTSRFR